MFVYLHTTTHVEASIKQYSKIIVRKAVGFSLNLVQYILFAGPCTLVSNDFDVSFTDQIISWFNLAQRFFFVIC